MARQTENYRGRASAFLIHRPSNEGRQSRPGRESYLKLLDLDKNLARSIRDQARLSVSADRLVIRFMPLCPQALGKTELKEAILYIVESERLYGSISNPALINGSENMQPLRVREEPKA